MTATLIGGPALHRRLHAVGGPDAKKNLLATIGLRAVANAKRTVARRTGHTGRTIRYVPGSIDSAEIRAGGASLYLERGTGLFGPKHRRIVPTSKKALSWLAGPAGTRPGGKGSPLRLSGRQRRGAAGAGAGRVTVRSIAGMPAQPFLVQAARDAASASGLASAVVKLWNDAA